MLRTEVSEAFDDYLNCGILYHGCALACCTECNHSELIAFSCKRRGLCASCDAKRAVIFAEQLYGTLLELPHCHVVFTIPKRLRVFFKYNRKLTKHLYTAAWLSWKELVEDEFPNTTSGMVMSLHSAGDLLNFHPHVHALALYGATDNKNNFYSLDSIDTDWLSTVFAQHLFKALLNEELLDQETVSSMQSWQHSGFNVWVGTPVAYSDTATLKFLARYLKKAPLSNQRIELLEEANLVRYSKSSDVSKTYRDFEPLQFLAEITQHIPNKWEQTTRYFGLYSARTRGAAKNKAALITNSVSLTNLDVQAGKPKPF